MAGHSHFSNIKHKKDRNSVSKSKNFLKLGDKIRLIIRDGSEASYKKAYSLARENNFPKEKIDSIIEKNRQLSSADKSSNFFSNLKLLKFDFNIMILLLPKKPIENKFPNSLKEKFNSFRFSEVENDKICNFFKQRFVLKIRSNSSNFEEALSLLADKGILEDVVDFSEVHDDWFNFRIVVFEKKIVGEIVKMSSNVIKEFIVEKEFISHTPVELLTDGEKSYFENLKKLTFKFFSKPEVFFNLL